MEGEEWFQGLRNSRTQSEHSLILVYRDATTVAIALGQRRALSFECCEARLLMVADLGTPIATIEGYLKYEPFALGEARHSSVTSESGETKSTSPSDPAVSNARLEQRTEEEKVQEPFQMRRAVFCRIRQRLRE